MRVKEKEDSAYMHLKLQDMRFATVTSLQEQVCYFVCIQKLILYQLVCPMALPDVNMVHNVLHSFKITYHHGFVMGLVSFGSHLQLLICFFFIIL